MTIGRICGHCQHPIESPGATACTACGAEAPFDALAHESARLEMERERLEMERERLELERQRLELGDEGGLDLESPREPARRRPVLASSGRVSARHSRSHANSGGSHAALVIVGVLALGAGAIYVSSQKADTEEVAETDEERRERIMAERKARALDERILLQGQQRAKAEADAAAQEAKRAEETAEAERVLKTTLEQARAWTASGQPQDLARARASIQGLTPQDDDGRGRVKTAEAKWAEAVAGLLAQTLSTANRLLEEGRWDEAFATFEAVAPVWPTLPLELQELKDAAEVGLAEEEAQAEVLDAAVAEAGEKIRSSAEQELEDEARQAAEAWFAQRSPESLFCSTCEGTQLSRCTVCGGDGKIKSRSSRGTVQRGCGSCRRGKAPCEAGYEGFRTLQLKRRFWDGLSPSARKGKKRSDFYRAVADRQVLRDVVGFKLVIQNAEIVSVTVQSHSVRVEADVLWAGGGRVVKYQTEWIRERGKWYVRTPDDRDPEPLLGE